MSWPDLTPPGRPNGRRFFLRSAERAGRRRSAREIRAAAAFANFAPIKAIARGRALGLTSWPPVARCRASYSEDLNPVRSRDLPLCQLVPLRYRVPAEDPDFRKEIGAEICHGKKKPSPSCLGAHDRPPTAPGHSQDFRVGSGTLFISPRSRVDNCDAVVRRSFTIHRNQAR